MPARSRRTSLRASARPRGARARPAPRIVCRLARRGHRRRSRGTRRRGSGLAGYGAAPNYRRILDIGGCDSPGDAAIVGDEASVTKQVNVLADAGVTDFWAAPFPVGADKKASRVRTNDLLKSLLP